MRWQRGFTLLEIMLVLVLLSLSAVVVIATLPTTQHSEAEKSAQSLFQRLQLLNEEALLSGLDFGLRVDEKNHRLTFLQFTQKGWQPIDKIGFAAQLPLDDRLGLQFSVGGGAWQDKDRLFIPGSLFDEQMFAEYQEQKAPPTPQVFILSSGEVTPFHLSVYPLQQSMASGWQVVVEENGQIHLLAPGESDDKA
ncbi:type II secretion system protein GspH [Vibrio cincinnatiensis]|jgi:general secretion pathway protein H|uniref:Type II secretion system protein H n=1 Tax=Vibrio cincinnatiensis DSM 19608 TaxID=1123491 RepID=A0A1T4RT68_VIBCI|nr:type II secretion system minor pseudopilin GspH [Vibrio cincinnatiensis]MCG3722666.1 type II secretion system protein GspH [Vibrio cincinnatiensis]MCG3725831.1 type II secretion system protein GspH [Vibrio cincinnatiensis]MCG3732764.1 type II secretion system protein GspH [Vibrio cincinnatiensis]MCG3736422.1 type II secretion system protein GspH [Vibrio cincinnatiensis]MCG3740096.1 type II secretion system protein GspH [Vibrio cincinnatiensis]